MAAWLAIVFGKCQRRHRSVELSFSPSHIRPLLTLLLSLSPIGSTGTLTFFSILTKTYSEFFNSKPTLSFTFSSGSPRRTRASRGSKDALQLGQRQRVSASLQVPNNGGEEESGSENGYERNSNNYSTDGFVERKERLNSLGEEDRLSDEKTRTNHQQQNLPYQSEKSKEPEIRDLSNFTDILPPRDLEQIDPLTSAAQVESIIDNAPPLDVRPGSQASSFETPNIRWDQSKWTKAQIWLPSSGTRPSSRGLDDVQK